MLGAAPKTSRAQLLGRILLGLMLVSSGVSHLTYLREPFQAQVPPWVPLSPDLVVVLSGCVEIILGLSLMALYRRKAYVGITAALFFVAVFPGNIAQYTEHRAAFGLDTDTARLVRLFFQPAVVAWALWSTGAWTGPSTILGQTRMTTVRCVKVSLGGSGNRDLKKQYRWPKGFISFERRIYDSSEHLKPQGDHDER
jgi:uncharacterized membrane protein